jgi:hypothetical protein
MDPIGRELNPEERAVLIVLTQDGRTSHDCTSSGVAIALERDTLDVAAVLGRLERDGLTSSQVDAQGQAIWLATAAAVEAL